MIFYNDIIIHFFTKNLHDDYDDDDDDDVIIFFFISLDSLWQSYNNSQLYGL